MTTCAECGEAIDWDDIDLETPTCPECDTPFDLDRGDDYDDYEPDDRGRGWDDRSVGAVDPVGNSIR